MATVDVKALKTDMRVASQKCLWQRVPEKQTVLKTEKHASLGKSDLVKDWTSSGPAVAGIQARTIHR